VHPRLARWYSLCAIMSPGATNIGPAQSGPGRPAQSVVELAGLPPHPPAPACRGRGTRSGSNPMGFNRGAQRGLTGYGSYAPPNSVRATRAYIICRSASAAIPQ
jgi:hypothetical protein